jgi:hypothetical protein
MKNPPPNQVTVGLFNLPNFKEYFFDLIFNEFNILTVYNPKTNTIIFK